MHKLFWDFGVPSLFVLGASILYSRALLAGIACARNQEHRLTPQSPWYFFMFEFKPKTLRISVGLVPWLAYGAFLSSHEAIIRGRAYNPYLDFADVLDVTVSRLLPQSLFMTSLSFAAITLIAPRFKHPGLLAGMATFGSFLTVFIPYRLWLKGLTSTLYLEFIGVLTICGSIVFLLTWLYVRFKLDRAWFRFKG